jgi:diguanylate cyclase (GGDEF)-like protein
MKILLLEDDIALNKAIKKVLELDDHTVDTFFSGQDVIDALDKPYHLYILDINVPELSGMAILDIILLQNTQAQVIMISSNTDVQSLQAAYDIGCVDYLKKPFHIAELRAKISRLELTREHLISTIQLKSEDEVLTKNERKLLSLLLDNLSQVVNYEMIENHVYENRSMSMDALRALMRRLRSKLADDIIVNIIDEGYSIPTLPDNSNRDSDSHTNSRIAFLEEENNRLKVEREILLKKSTTDPLTGLYNRLKIQEIFLYEQQQFIRSKETFSIILMDLDNFKWINDLHGHNTGDKYLKEFANMLKTFSRNVDIIGRWGGEEFIILLPETSLEQAEKIAQRLQENIKNMDCPKLGKRTASFGLTKLAKEDTLSSFVGRADEALLEAKREGKDRIKVRQ